MKLILTCVLFVAVTHAASNNDDPIVNESNVEYNGKFHSHVHLQDGTQSVQKGELKHIKEDAYGESITGQFTFVGDDGQVYTVSYIADENGYQPIGNHLPTPPPTPDYVLRSLQYQKDHPPKTSEKQY